MGGFFSTRWNYTSTRAETDGLLFLDAADLRRMGSLTAGAHAWQQWTNGRGEIVGSIRTVTNAARDTLTLVYSIRRQGEAWQPVREEIRLQATPCHYGGERLWLTCPGCQSRRRVLYSVEGRFRCRGCHKLAYTSTRLDGIERSARRIAALHVRLKADRIDLFAIPPRPQGMRRTTYDRLVGRLTEEQDRQTGYFQAVHERLMPSVAGVTSTR
jgi:hypothetical protein